MNNIEWLVPKRKIAQKKICSFKHHTFLLTFTSHIREILPICTILRFFKKTFSMIIQQCQIQCRIICPSFTVLLVHITIILLVLMKACQSKKPKTTLSPGVWSKWSTWQECSKTCGIGIRRRTRTCSYNGNKSYLRCKGKQGQMKNCDTKLTCPIHGGWSSWTAWQCTVTCGGGDGAQRRSCTNPKPMFGGKGCNGTAKEEGKCNTQKCPDQVFTLSPMTAQAVKNSIDSVSIFFRVV